jgi:hypothetical protein
MEYGTHTGITNAKSIRNSNKLTQEHKTGGRYGTQGRKYKHDVTVPTYKVILK